MSLIEFIGQEVFIVTSGEEEDEGKIFACLDIYEVIEYMKLLNPDTDSGTRVFHGILESAEVLPKNLRNKSVFLMFLNPVDGERGYVAESGSATPSELALEIETSMAFGVEVFREEPSIEDVLILYGYQLETCLSVRDDDLDEEVIYTCKKISEDIEELKESAGVPMTIYGGYDE